MCLSFYFSQVLSCSLLISQNKGVSLVFFGSILSVGAIYLYNRMALGPFLNSSNDFIYHLGKGYTAYYIHHFFIVKLTWRMGKDLALL